MNGRKLYFPQQTLVTQPFSKNKPVKLKTSCFAAKSLPVSWDLFLMMLSAQTVTKLLYHLKLVTPWHFFVRLCRFFVKSSVCVACWDWRPRPHKRQPARSLSISVLHTILALWFEAELYRPTCFCLFHVTVTGHRYNFSPLFHRGSIVILC